MVYAYYFSTDEQRFERFHYEAVARFISLFLLLLLLPS